MTKKTYYRLGLAAFFFFQTCNLIASQAGEQEFSRPSTQDKISISKITPFTGKIMRNKVRLRAQPNLDGAIVRELNIDDLVVIDGELNDFYAVQPPEDMKAYVYRTYILDGVIEGNHVNVRLSPDMSAPSIAQMNAGEPVKGTVSTADKKWLEINVPSSARFYVAKEYISNVGDGLYLAKLKRRREEVSALLESARTGSQTELKKTFEQVNLNPITQKLTTIVSQYNEFPSEVTKAKELLNSVQTAYLNKKVEYMEKLAMSSNQNQAARRAPVLAASTLPASVTGKMAVWLPVEEALYEKWAKQSEEKPSKEDFYREQEKNAVTVRGILEPYMRTVKNKPGDFILTSPISHLPLAYLYSTQVNLQELSGQEVTLKVVQRDNRQFAHPAYFVLAVE